MKKRHPVEMMDGYVVAKKDFTKRVLLGIPMTGLIRAEWHLNYVGMVTPCNWSQSAFVHVFEPYSPLKFLVADARNLIVQKAIVDGFEWIVFIDHDVLLPPDILLKFNERMLKKDVPIMGGLYFTKSVPAEPLVYRGRGNSYYADWKLGEKIWVDGMGLGCHLIHSSIFKVMYEESETYQIEPGVKVRRVFETPVRVEIDPISKQFINGRGTEDLPWYTRIMEEDIFKKAGWPEFQKKKYPYLCDTSIFCLHIDTNGKRYPSAGEEGEFKRRGHEDKSRMRSKHKGR